MTRIDFANTVAQHLRSALGDSVYVRLEENATAISCYRNGEELGTLQLHNLYDDFLKADPRDHQWMLDKWAGYFLFDYDKHNDFDNFKDWLLPSLRPNSEFPLLLHSMGAEHFTTTPYCWDHSTILCIDSETNTTIVNNDNIAAWGKSIDELNELAMRNLLGITQEAEFAMVAQGVYIGGWCDTYDSSRLMLTGLFGLLEMVGDPVAIIGSKETIFVTGSRDVDGLAVLLKLGLLACDKPRAVYGLPIVLQNDRWDRFDLPPGHPVHTQLVDYHREIANYRMRDRVSLGI